jgi:hypothetical protein
VSIAETLCGALGEARAAGGSVLVAGSLFLAGEALAQLGLADGAQEWSAQ